MVLRSIKKEKWKQFKKEVVAAILEAVIYRTWKARNWKNFRGTNVNTEVIVVQIKK